MFGWMKGARRAFARGAALVAVVALAGCGEISIPGLGGGGADDGGPTIDPKQPVPVALLLPRGSGAAGDELIATSLERAARLAVSDLQGAQIDLRVYATAGNPQTAAGVAVQAVNEGAKIILGPVYGASAAAVGAAVAPQGVSVLTFSNNTDVAGRNVFVLGNTFENTADRLISYAVGQGKNSMVIVSASDVAEQKGAGAAAAALARNGGVVAGTASFELSQTGVVAAIPTIASTVKSSGANAVFFTSGTAGALPIVTQLLTEQGVDPATTQFVGLQRWDVPASALELRPLQGGWFAVPAPGPLGAFRSRYQAAHGASPHAIAGLAYDGVAALGALISGGKRTAFSPASLTQSTGFAGVNGVFRLKPDGSNERGLAVATIRENKVVILDPAPRSFRGAGS